MSENSYTFPEDRFSTLEMEGQTVEGDGQISGPKIQRVPAFLRQNAEFDEYCSPKMISFGPIHHGNENLKQGEHCKLFWTSMYLEEYYRKTNNAGSKKDAAQFLHKSIEDKIKELKKLFTEDAIGSHDDKGLAWMLFVDGCSLLYFMKKIDLQHPEALKLKLDQLIYMWRDIQLLENQLPWRVLELLSMTKTDLEHLKHKYLSMCLPKRPDEVPELRVELPKEAELLEEAKTIHILDFARSKLLSPSKKIISSSIDKNEQEFSMICQTCRNIRDLKAAGIVVKANEQNGLNLGNISFEPKWFTAELRLPRLVFTDGTPSFFLNVIAYELCPDFKNNYECCAFLAFMDSLVDNADDVKELRSAGVIQNFLGTDQKLADFFNELGTNLPSKLFNELGTDFLKSSHDMAYGKEYLQVWCQIEKHYRNKFKTWGYMAFIAHFENPWGMLAFYAALLALVLTFIQTWYTIHPKLKELYKKLYNMLTSKNNGSS